MAERQVALLEWIGLLWMDSTCFSDISGMPSGARPYGGRGDSSWKLSSRHIQKLVFGGCCCQSSKNIWHRR